MAWQRGNQSVEVELSKVQSWIEDTDPVLNGTGGSDRGLIREHNDMVTIAREREEAHKKQDNRRTIIISIVAVGTPFLIKILEHLHIL